MDKGRSVTRPCNISPDTSGRSWDIITKIYFLFLHFIPIFEYCQKALDLHQSCRLYFIQWLIVHILRRYECNWCCDLIFIISCIQPQLIIIEIKHKNKESPCLFLKYIALNTALKWHKLKKYIYLYGKMAILRLAPVVYYISLN